MKPSIIICDIDWVLADERVRRKKYLTPDHKDYDGYYSDVSNDWHISHLWSFLNGKNIIFITGRRESCRKQTLEWLDKRPYLKAKSENLLMRRDHDYRRAVDLKEIHLIQLLQEYEVTLAIDDNQEICEMYNRYGIPTMCCRFYDLETNK